MAVISVSYVGSEKKEDLVLCYSPHATIKYLAGWVAALVSYFIISIFDFSLSRLCVGTNLSPSFLEYHSINDGD
jgi:hypothetical protein